MADDEFKIMPDKRGISLKVMEQVKSVIISKIDPGAKIMSIRMMAKTVGVNPCTVAKVYAELQEEGLLKCKGAEGTFVTENRSRIELARQKLLRQYVGRFGKELKGLTRSDGSQVSLEEVMKMLKETIKGRD